MTRKTKGLAALAGLIGLAGTGVAAEVATYDCAVTSLEGRGFVSDRVVFSIDPAQNRAKVIDGTVYYVHKEPIDAVLNKENGGRYRLKWQVKNIKSGSNSFNVDYTLTFRQSQSAVSIRANVKGFDNRPTGSGSCKLVQGQTLFN